MPKRRFHNSTRNSVAKADDSARPNKRAKFSADVPYKWNVHETKALEHGTLTHKRLTDVSTKASSQREVLREVNGAAFRVNSPPPGLSARQRKRWRRKERKAALALPLERSATRVPEINPQDQDDTFKERQTASVKRINPVLLHRTITTQLLARPRKQWIEASAESSIPARKHITPPRLVPGNSGSPRHDVASDHAPFVGTEPVAYKPDGPDGSSVPQLLTKAHRTRTDDPSHDDGDSDDVDNDTHNSEEDPSTSSSFTHSVRQNLTKNQQIVQQTNFKSVVKTPNRSKRIVYDSTLVHRNYGLTSASSQPVTRRAVAVPARGVGSATDVKNAFQRFSTYLAGGSDDDTVTSSDESSKYSATGDRGSDQKQPKGETSSKTHSSLSLDQQDTSHEEKATTESVNDETEYTDDDYQRVVEESDLDEGVGIMPQDAAAISHQTVIEVPTSIWVKPLGDQNLDYESQNRTDSNRNAGDDNPSPKLQCDEDRIDAEELEQRNGEESVEDGEDPSEEDEDEEHESIGPPRPRLPGDCLRSGQHPDAAMLTSQSSTGTPVWRANVGMKRQLSFLDHRRGGNGSRHGQVSEQALDAKPVPRTVVDDDDLFRTIDEVASGVFDFTRPLPAIESANPWDKRADPALLTRPASKRKPRFLDPNALAKGMYKVDALRSPSPQVVICRSVRLLEDAPSDMVNGIYEAEAAQEVESMHGIPLEKRASSSSLSELGRTPSPPKELESGSQAGNDPGLESVKSESLDISPSRESQGSLLIKKRKMTGMTSKHFTPEKQKRRTRVVSKTEFAELEIADSGSTLDGTMQADAIGRGSNEQEVDAETLKAIVDASTRLTPVSQRTRSAAKVSTTKTKRKSTGKKSDHFLPFHLLDRVDLPTPTKRGRVPAGTSTAPVPSILSERFGIIQEKLSDQPFWLIIATVFLNKTAGRSAAPTFWALKERFPTPEDLAQVDQKDLHDMIHHLGLQTQRSKRLIKISEAWVANPPRAGRRYRTLHYPTKDDGKQYKKTEIIETDDADCAGALEIGHVPGCGPYAWDSFRAFSRDIMRNVAEDYNGKGAKDPAFEPEWKRVVPLDKELRATFRWMWLKEGFIWDHETGDKRPATAEEMEKAVKGEMEVPDAGELKFAAEAASKVDGDSTLSSEARLEDIVAQEATQDESVDDSDNIVVAIR